MGYAQKHCAAHRVSQREEWRRAIRQYHLLHQGFDIDLVLGEAANVTLAGVMQLPRGMSLPAPVDHRHRETTCAQIAYGLEIFFDRFSPSGEQAHRTLAARRRGPARETQIRAVRCLDDSGDDIVGHRISGNGKKRHEQLALPKIWNFSLIGPKEKTKAGLCKPS